MGYQVFISFKKTSPDGNGVTRDYRLAEELYNALTAEGISAFFSEEKLRTSDFMSEISRALEEASVFVLVGTKRSHVESQWVRHEWETFLKAILDGRKPNGQLYTYLVGMSTHDLPMDLSTRQSYDKLSALVTRIKQNLGGSAPSREGSFSHMSSPMAHLRAGDRVTFGQYPQGRRGEVMPLTWRVLTVREGKALLITEKLIDAQPYNKTLTDVTWETCTLRRWMNDDFYYRAFSMAEQAQIATVTLPNPDNPKGTPGGNPTQDSIFALSIEEAERYFDGNWDRKCSVTAYTARKVAEALKKVNAKGWKDRIAKFDSYSQTAATADEAPACWWWLRSPGDYSDDAADVLDDGGIYQCGLDVVSNLIAVRPAFWLHLKS